MVISKGKDIDINHSISCFLAENFSTCCTFGALLCSDWCLMFITCPQLNLTTEWGRRQVVLLISGICTHRCTQFCSLNGHFKSGTLHCQWWVAQYRNGRRCSGCWTIDWNFLTMWAASANISKKTRLSFIPWSENLLLKATIF